MGGHFGCCNKKFQWKFYVKGGGSPLLWSKLEISLEVLCNARDGWSKMSLNYENSNYLAYMSRIFRLTPLVEVEIMNLHALSANFQTSLKFSPGIHHVLLFQIRPGPKRENIIITS